MTNRELLERAARAAGMVLDYSIRPDGKAFYHSERNALALADGGWFAPLTDDGDALRLAAKLKLNIVQGDFSVGVNNEAEIDDVSFVPDESQRLFAIREAITRAAAAMAPD